jgi:hypothetical protein
MSGFAHLLSSSNWGEKLLPSIKSRVGVRGISHCTVKVHPSPLYEQLRQFAQCRTGLQSRTGARRPDRSERRSDRALRRSLNEAAYAKLALAGAATAPLHCHEPHTHELQYWAKAGAANTVANATAAISVFMTSLHRTHRRRAGLLTCHRIRFGERNCYLPSNHE